MTDATISSKYETVIGLEVHAQLATASKMYCRCASDYADAPPNTRVCPVCLGLPGVLPVINKKAVEFTMMTALALNCTIAPNSKFDRKNYAYPDLMKGYQISQYDEPIGRQGWIDVAVDGKIRRIGITRVHLEEDVAKLLHRDELGGPGYSLVDVNRSGVPLMEIVSEPDMRTPEEARQYLMKLRTILRYLGVSVANMEEGSFRCDANISLRPTGETKFNPKVEVKNMNSFRAVFRALEYEEVRQAKDYDNGVRVPQETRGWQDEKGVTVSQRSKEFAHDYRYFPEPDLPPLQFDEKWIAQIRARLPELPEARQTRFVSDYQLSDYDAAILTSARDIADYFEGVLSADLNVTAKDAANWVNGEVARILNAANANIDAFSVKVPAAALAKLIAVTAKGAINTATAKTVLEEMWQSGKTPEAIISEKGLAQISDDSALRDMAAKIIGDNPAAVADFKAGKEQSLKFLVGQMMKLSKGRANPAVASDIILQKLKES
ncbi:Asp-tRNA(Asn)/Glu-tRNA(Gln) amidotransferase subunit GatB [Dehalogenimonas etheniformans]|uniref:Aspartyl/glutamyl-tRNA(Asn/Gln) amidotransferase subunit B n=1 Tax=Dehalogenimonas etheniformans TaxID=1536648 RepID=A0A2P5P6S1_9CHLR|nr:Asp-tRNA(Asn)/Glu-tRNA(Gln) amidotransferase subunit GatB [Dehalogenimonas etheniformans]PPD58006.1 Asp-tRNA(Asn)/Glu-tRNA(Gln) amidotransferase subunit GatB [Dehalogenimonas etheniformans]QNT75355.1 Asp-tRNA(Asn)/Glu-tRNA(Gln) amidotransferase subunit GatB [Dehalogenimonas etheniformans]